MTLDALIKALSDHGISEIKADGEKFDPKLHQAVQTVDAVKDQKPDHVVQQHCKKDTCTKIEL